MLRFRYRIMYIDRLYGAWKMQTPEIIRRCFRNSICELKIMVQSMCHQNRGKFDL